MPAQRIAGRYEVIRLLGEGPMGKVYHVRDHEHDGEEATLKILRAEALDYDELANRLEPWNLRIKALAHPRINPLRQVGQTPLGLLYLTSDYSAGEDLGRLSARRGPLPPRRALTIVRQVLEGLATAHGQDFPHGSLHPHNVLLLERVPATRNDPFGTGVLVLDHGLQDLIGRPRAPEDSPYHAPEIADGSTPASDVYATGMLLRELLAGPDASAPIPPHLVGLLDGATAGDSTERYCDAAGFLTALDTVEEAQALEPEEPNAAPATEIAERERELDRREQQLAGRLDAETAASRELGPLRARISERDATVEKLRHERDAAVEAQRARTYVARDVSVGSAPLGGYPLAVALAVFSLVITWLLWQERDHTRAAQGTLQDARLEAQRIPQLEDDLHRAREIARALEIERDQARAGEVQSSESLVQRDEQLAQLQGRVGGLESDLTRARDPMRRAREQLALVLAALDTCDAEGAITRFELMSATWPDILQDSGLPPLIRVASALCLPRNTLSARAQLERVVGAERDLALAAEELPGLTAAAWVTAEDDRLSTGVERTLGALGERLEEERVALGERLEARWNALLHQDPDGDPNEVLAIAERLGGERLSEFLEAYASHLREIGERDSMLVLSALAEQRHLQAWAEVIAGRSELADSIAGREVLLLRYALAWNASAADEPAPSLPVFFQDADGGPPTTHWRRDLALRAGLAQPDSAWPGALGSRYLFHNIATVGGESTRIFQLDQVTEIAPDRWTLHRSYYRVDGSNAGSHDVELIREGRRFTEVGSPGGPLLDLFSEQTVTASWSPTELVEPPPDLVGRDEWEEFRAALGDEPLEALVHEAGGVRGWFSPRWGCLVRESPGSFRRELIYAAPVRPSGQ